ncbi:hypothetical protein ACOME3_006046 [Neoechinorhynchus agilis]
MIAVFFLTILVMSIKSFSVNIDYSTKSTDLPAYNLTIKTPFGKTVQFLTNQTVAVDEALVLVYLDAASEWIRSFAGRNKSDSVIANEEPIYVSELVLNINGYSSIEEDIIPELENHSNVDNLADQVLDISDLFPSFNSTTESTDHKNITNISANLTIEDSVISVSDLFSDQSPKAKKSIVSRQTQNNDQVEREETKETFDWYNPSLLFLHDICEGVFISTQKPKNAYNLLGFDCIFEPSKHDFPILIFPIKSICITTGSMDCEMNNELFRPFHLERRSNRALRLFPILSQILSLCFLLIL